MSCGRAAGDEFSFLWIGLTRQRQCFISEPRFSFFSIFPQTFSIGLLIMGSSSVTSLGWIRDGLGRHILGALHRPTSAVSSEALRFAEKVLRSNVRLYSDAVGQWQYLSSCGFVCVTPEGHRSGQLSRRGGCKSLSAALLLIK